MMNKLYLLLFSFFSILYSQDHSDHSQMATMQNHNIPTNTMNQGSQDMNHKNMSDMNHEMIGMYGSYPMTREASGTSWLPDSSPMEGIHFMKKDWTFMVGGFSYLVYDKQAGSLGGKKVIDENMFMFMGHTKLHDNILGFRTMFSLEGLTIGKCGYPLLFQTGETCDGITPLINKQHPHDLFMELALTYAYLFDKDTSAFLYFGFPGEPALGPSVFMMRFASEYIPSAPLGHHWLDSTHITYGVITGGIIHKGLKCEVSGFKGKEPDQNRFDFEKLKIDSYSFRLSYNPNENWSMQASYGFLKSPEQLEPNKNTHRYTLSAIYNKAVDQCFNWQTIFTVGVNKNEPGHTLPAFLVDSTFEYKKKHLIFGRFESILKDELFLKLDPLFNRKFNINKFSFGYIYEFMTNNIKWGLGSSFDAYILPFKVDERYKIDSLSYMIFLQMRLIEF